MMDQKREDLPLNVSPEPPGGGVGLSNVLTRCGRCSHDFCGAAEADVAIPVQPPRCLLLCLDPISVFWGGNGSFSGPETWSDPAWGSRRLWGRERRCAPCFAGSLLLSSPLLVVSPLFCGSRCAFPVATFGLLKVKMQAVDEAAPGVG